MRISRVRSLEIFSDDEFAIRIRSLGQNAPEHLRDGSAHASSDHFHA